MNFLSKILKKRFCKLCNYNSLEFCPVYNYYKSMADVRYLLILDNYYNLPDITEKETKKLEDVRDKLQGEHNSTTSDKVDKLTELYKTLTRLQLDQKWIYNVLCFLQYKYSGYDLDFEFFENELAAMDYKLNYTNETEFYKEIERLIKRAGTKDKQIKRVGDEIKNLLDDKNKNKKGGYIKEFLLIEKHANIKIDIYKDSMLKFIEATNITIEIINNKQKAA